MYMYEIPNAFVKKNKEINYNFMISMHVFPHNMNNMSTKKTQ